MASIKGGAIKSMASAPASAPTTQSPLSMMVSSKSVQERFEKMLGDKSAGFLSSLLTLVNNNALLTKADPRSVLAAAATAASLDLPINPSLGKAWVVPYKGSAQFQIGYKGVIELAIRSKQMEYITMTPVYEGEITDWNRFTESYTAGSRVSDNIVGYFAAFKLKSGFRKATYWTKEEVIAHAKRFSKAFNSGPWQSDFDSMACKTVLMSIMKTYAPLSVEMQKALDNDSKVASVDDKGNEDFVDIEFFADEEPAQVVDEETGEILKENKDE